MKECSGKKVLIVKVAQDYPLDSTSQKNFQVDSEVKDKDKGQFNMTCKTMYFRLQL